MSTPRPSLRQRVTESIPICHDSPVWEWTFYLSACAGALYPDSMRQLQYCKPTGLPSLTMQVCIPAA